MATDTMQTSERAVERATGRANDLADTARKTVDGVTERTRKTVDQVAESAAQVADRLSTQANDALSQALRYTSKHPLQSLAAVLVAGFIVGRITRRD